MLDDVASSATAIRTDIDGTRVEASFAGSGDASMFVVGHLPVESRGALIVCPPILGEFIVTYRREVNLARTMARAGIAVERFHYRGTGHSEGDESVITLDTMVEDAMAAYRVLEERIHPPRIAFLGTRWGALVAAACAARLGGAPLILWDPVIDPKAFLEEAIRARVFRRMRKRQGRRTSMREELAQLDEVGILDILGYELPKALIDSVGGMSVPQILAGSSDPVLTVMFGARGGRRPAGDRASSELRPTGPPVEVVTISEELPVWFSGASTQGSKQLLDTTTRWLLEVMSSDVSRT